MNPVALATILAAAGAVSLVLALIGTRLAIPLARRIGYVDQPGAHKSHTLPTPYGGGLAILLATWLPLAAVVIVSWLVSSDWIAETFGAAYVPYFGGLIERRGQALVILAGGLVLHVLGLVDDVHPLGPVPKLTVMFAVALFVTTAGEVRLAEFAGAWIATILSAVWIVVIINAFNFLDNMDGLSAGVASICLGLIVACGVLAGQVFVPALGCVFLGGILGFLVFNFPPARIFMGDAGSLVVGYMLAVTSVLTTYFESGSGAAPYALAMPIIILAVPLYDCLSVTMIRVAEGRHPMQGDQRHFSHRLVDHGLSRRFAVMTIYLATAATGLSATLLPGCGLRETITILAFVFMVLAIIAILEMPVGKSS